MVTIVTKKVGAAGAGRDYGTLAAAIAALPANLVTADQAWVFELYNDSEFNENITLSGHTTDATRSITFKAAAGQSFYDQASKLTNALRYDQSKGVAIALLGGFAANAVLVSDNYVTFDGLQFNHPGTASTFAIISFAGSNCLLKNSIVRDGGAGADGYATVEFQSGSTSCGAVNSLVIVNNTTALSRRGWDVKSNTCYVINCGALRSSAGGSNVQAYARDYGTPLIRNCWSFGFHKFGKDTTAAAGSGYNASDLAAGNTAGTNNLYGLAVASQIQSSTAGSEDARAKAGSALSNAGTRDATYTADLDIVKSARSTSTPTIGPWEFASGGGGGGSAKAGIRYFYQPRI